MKTQGQERRRGEWPGQGKQVVVGQPDGLGSDKESSVQSGTRKEGPLSSLGLSREGGGQMFCNIVRSGHCGCGSEVGKSRQGDGL